MPTDDQRRYLANRLRDEAEYGCVNAFDLACVLGLEAVSSTAYDSESVMRLADMIEPLRYKVCPHCGRQIEGSS